MASISYRDHFLSYYRNEIEIYNQTDCERDLSLMEKWLREDPKTPSRYSREEYFVHADLVISGALSNSFFSKPEQSKIRTHALDRLSLIRKRFTKLIKGNEVNRKEFYELSLKFQRLLRRRKILIKKLNHTNTQISALKAQLEQTSQEIENLHKTINDNNIDSATRQTATQKLKEVAHHKEHLVNLHKNLDVLDEIGMKIANLAEKIIFLQTAMS